jgi:branched-chain amino acid transport system substrate-binding protein
MTTRLRFLAAGLLAATACGDPEPAKDPVTIGLLMPVTGDLAARGRYFIDAALLVADQVNAGGGLLGGREMLVAVKDSGTTPAGAMVGFADLLDQNVDGMIGPSSSGEARALAPQIKTGNRLVIGPSTSSSALSTIDFGGNFYRMVAPDVIQSEVLADLIEAANLTKLCVVARDDVYGNGIADAVLARFPGRAGFQKVTYDPMATDLSTVLDPCGQPDRTGGKINGILFASLIADGAAMMDQASSAKYGWSSTDKVFLTDGTRDSDLIGLLNRPEFVRGATGTASRGPDPASPDGAAYVAYREAFMAKYDGREPDVYSEMAFDAAYVLALAIEIAGGSEDIEQLKGTLSKLSTGTSFAAGDWAAMRAEIASAGQLDYRGASGDVTFAPPSPDTLGPYFIEVWTLTGTPLMPTSVEIRRITR